MTSEISASERTEFENTLARRLGRRGNGAELATASLVAAQRHLIHRAQQLGPVPTTLTVERSAVLVEISKALGRVVEDYEIEALFRVTASQARAMRLTLLASYADVTDELTIRWALVDATTGERRSTETFTGPQIEFASEDRLRAFVSQMRRAGIDVEVVHDEEATPWLVVVGDDFPENQLPLGKSATKAKAPKARHEPKAKV